MSARPVRLRRPPGRSIGAAAGMVERVLVDTDAPKQTKHLGRPSAEMKAEHRAWADLQPSVVRCLHCPGWSFRGTAGEARAASVAHRAVAHPGTPRRKRGRAEEKAAAIRAAAARSGVREGEPQRGHVQDGLTLGGGGASPPPSPSQTSAADYANTLAKSETNLRWNRAHIITAIQDWHTEHGQTPAATDWKRGSPTHPSNATVIRCFGGWSAGISAAGFEARGWGQNRRDGA